jgi:hypothetical protein
MIPGKQKDFPNSAPPFPRRSRRFHVCGKNLTFPAYRHFFAPAFLNLPMTYRTVDKPAEVPHIEFPGGTGLAGWKRTAPNIPAEMGFFAPSSLEGLQKKHLTLDVHRNFPPTLFKTLNRLERCSQELRHLLLGLLQFLPKRMELLTVHGYPSFAEEVKKIWGVKIFLDKLYHIVLSRQKFFSFCQRSQMKFLLKESISRRSLSSLRRRGLVCP